MKAVFPIPGLAATIIRSDFCQPEVIASRDLKPLATPVTPNLVSFLDSISLIVSLKIVFISV